MNTCQGALRSVIIITIISNKTNDWPLPRTPIIIWTPPPAPRGYIIWLPGSGRGKAGRGVNTWRHIWLYQLYTELLTVIPDRCQACVKFQLPALKPKVDYADHAEWSGTWKMLSCTFWILLLHPASLLFQPFVVVVITVVFSVSCPPSFCSFIRLVFFSAIFIAFPCSNPHPHIYCLCLSVIFNMHETFDVDKVWCPFFHLHFLRSIVFIWHHVLTTLWPHFGLVKSRNTAAQNSNLYRSTSWITSNSWTNLRQIFSNL